MLFILYFIYCWFWN